MTRFCLRICLWAGLITVVNPSSGQTPPAAQTTLQPAPPTREPGTPGYVAAKELSDGANPPANSDGNFIIGPSHEIPSDTNADAGIPKGNVIEFTMNSTDSKIYPGIARDAGTFGAPDSADAAKLVVTTSHPAAYRRTVTVYVPNQYAVVASRQSWWGQTARMGCSFQLWIC